MSQGMDTVSLSFYVTVRFDDVNMLFIIFFFFVKNRHMWL